LFKNLDVLDIVKNGSWRDMLIRISQI
jgi:hypothetical protein